MKLLQKNLSANAYPKIFGIVLVVSLLFVSIGVAPSGAATSIFQQDINNIQSAGSSSVVGEAVNGRNATDAVAGTSQLGTTLPVATNTNYRTGSVTKTFVAVVILQLVGEGKLSLDDTVEHWLPGEIAGNGNDGTKITIRELLNHTSGLFDYTADPGFDNTILTPDEFYANKDHQYTPQDLVSIALSHQPNFAPGTSWSYSSTNYIIAGQIIKAVTDNTWDVEVTNRIVKPLGLTQTVAPGNDETMPTPFAHAYNIWSSSPSDRIYSDTTEDNLSWGDSAGALISTTRDETKFFSALLSGKLLAPAQMAEMKTTVPVSSNLSFGLGIAATKMNCTGMKGLLWWHNGGTIGYDTWVGTTDDGSVSLAYDTSTSSFTGSDNAYLSHTLGAEDALVRHVFCGNSSTSSTSITQQESLLNGNPNLP